MSSNLSEAIENVLSDEDNVREVTAPHQHDFPYDREEEAQVTRREFCNFLFLTSGALFLGAAGFAAKAAYDSQSVGAFLPLRIEGAKELQPGASLNFRYPVEKETAILVRTLDGQYYAYGQKCTHLTCPVYFSKENQRLECPCHEGGFDAKNGNVLYGPPPRPLDRVEVEVRDNGEVWAVGLTRRGHNNG